MDKGSKIIVSVYGVVAALIGIALPLPLMARLFQDDAFFYFSIARNFAEGHGSTFDGLHLTNGYHPLWMFLLSGLDRLVPLRGELGLRAILLLCAALFALALVVAAKVMDRSGLNPRLKHGVLLSLIAFLGFANFGMEAWIWLLSFWWFAGAMLRLCEDEVDARSIAIAALATLACYWSRSDSILFIFTMGAYVTAVRMRKKGFAGAAQSLGGIWLPVVAGAATQVAVNLKYFGNAKTISSDLKTNAISFGLRMLHSADERGLQPLIHKAVFFAVFLGSLVLAALLFRKVTTHWRNLLIGANAYVALFCLAALLTLREPPRTWYYTVAFAILIASIAAIANDSGDRQNSRIRLATTGFAVLSLASLAGLAIQYKKSPRENSLEMAAWLKANTEPDEVAFAADGSGIINYFSERPVINGDGLVNDFAYREVLDRGTQADYLRQNRVSIFIANVNRASPSEPLPKTVEMYASTYHDHPGYRFASVDSKKALADFTKDGFFGYLPFAVSDLTFDVPFYQR